MHNKRYVQNPKINVWGNSKLRPLAFFGRNENVGNVTGMINFGEHELYLGRKGGGGKLFSRFLSFLLAVATNSEAPSLVSEGDTQEKANSLKMRNTCAKLCMFLWRIVGIDRLKERKNAFLKAIRLALGSSTAWKLERCLRA